MDRRMVLTGMAGLAFGASPAAAVTPYAAGTVRLLVGTFSHEGGKGAQLVETSDDGVFVPQAQFPHILGASYGAFDAVRRRVYVTVRDAGQVAAYGLNQMTLEALGPPRPSMANNPCYVSLSPERTHLAVANFADDVTAIYAIHPDTGEIQGEAQVLRSEGARTGGHAHWVQWSPDGRAVYVIDLGHEEVRFYDWDRAKGVAGAPQTAFSLAKGSGPRHLAWARIGPFAFLLTEKSGEVISLRREADGSFSEVSRLTARRKDFTGEYAAAHIAINEEGDRVYISERGPDSISVYTVAGDGRLSHLQTIASGGAWPRFFLLLEPEKRLLAANQRGHSITAFDIQADGTLTATGLSHAVEAPVYIEAVWRP